MDGGTVELDDRYMLGPREGLFDGNRVGPEDGEVVELGFDDGMLDDSKAGLDDGNLLGPRVYDKLGINTGL